MSGDVQVKKATEVIVLLEYPVEVGGLVYNELTVRRPKGRDRLVSSQMIGDLNQEYTYLALLSGVSLDVFEEMDGSDIDRVQETVKGFKSPISAKKT